MTVTGQRPKCLLHTRAFPPDATTDAPRGGLGRSVAFLNQHLFTHTHTKWCEGKNPTLATDLLIEVLRVFADLI